MFGSDPIFTKPEDKKNIIEGKEAIYASGQCGAPLSHLDAFKDAAEQTHYAIIIREISPFARYFIERGNPSKPYEVKNKSSDVGPLAGLIAADERHARLDSKKKASITAQMKEHKSDLDKAKKEAKKAGYELENVSLQLSKERIDELCGMKNKTGQKVMEASKPAEDGSIVLSWTNAGTPFEAIAKLREDKTTYDILEKDTGKPIEVLGRKMPNEEVLPITADYDIFYIAVPYAEIDPQMEDKPPHHLQQRGIFDIRESIRKNPREVSGKGNITPRLEKLLSILNNFIAAYDDKRSEDYKDTSAHHTADFKGHGHISMYLKTETELPTVEALDLKAENIPTLIEYNKKYYLYAYKDKEDKTALTKVDASLVDKSFNFKLSKPVKLESGSPLYQHIVKTKENFALIQNYTSRRVVKTQNKKMMMGLQMMHHNQELYSPNAKILSDNIPLLVILPSIDGYASRVFLATHPSAVVRTREYLIEHGFYFPTHPEYKEFKGTVEKYKKDLAEGEEKLKQAEAAARKIREEKEKASPPTLTAEEDEIEMRSIVEEDDKPPALISTEDDEIESEEYKKDQDTLKGLLKKCKRLVKEEKHYETDVDIIITKRNEYIENIKQIKPFLDKYPEEKKKYHKDMEKQLEAWDIDIETLTYNVMKGQRAEAIASNINGAINHLSRQGKKKDLVNLIENLDELSFKESLNSEEQEGFRKTNKTLIQLFRKYYIEKPEGYIDTKTVLYLKLKMAHYTEILKKMQGGLRINTEKTHARGKSLWEYFSPKSSHKRNQTSILEPSSPSTPIARGLFIRTSSQTPSPTTPRSPFASPKKKTTSPKAPVTTPKGKGRLG